MWVFHLMLVFFNSAPFFSNYLTRDESIIGTQTSQACCRTYRRFYPPIHSSHNGELSIDPESSPRHFWVELLNFETLFFTGCEIFSIFHFLFRSALFRSDLVCVIFHQLWKLKKQKNLKFLKNFTRSCFRLEAIIRWWGCLNRRWYNVVTKIFRKSNCNSQLTLGRWT